MNVLWHTRLAGLYGYLLLGRCFATLLADVAAGVFIAERPVVEVFLFGGDRLSLSNGPLEVSPQNGQRLRAFPLCGAGGVEWPAIELWLVFKVGGGALSPEKPASGPPGPYRPPQESITNVPTSPTLSFSALKARQTASTPPAHPPTPPQPKLALRPLKIPHSEGS